MAVLENPMSIFRPHSYYYLGGESIDILKATHS